MRIRKVIAIVLAAAALPLAGCGSGSGGTAVSHTVSGVASKGIIKNGTNNVKIYALKSDGTKGNLLATTSTGAGGEYAADLGSYTGPVLVEASGTYTDEATGQPVTIPEGKPLRAACDVAGSVTVAVTPLTELAVEKTGGALTKDNITQANAEVSTFFNLDIIGTRPVDAKDTALAGATAAQKKYTLALAAISQMANSASADAVYTVLDNIRTAPDPAQTAGQFAQALQAFADNANNNTGVTSSTIPAELLNVGATTALVKLNLSGGSATIYGIDLTLDLPAGVTIAADADGTVAPAALIMGGAGSAGRLAIGKFIPATETAPAKVAIALENSGGFAAGEILTLACAVAQGTPTFGDSLVESGAKMVNATGGAVTGATISVTAQ